jgi:phage/plasmid-like protein (TIGR03299 family)
MSHEMYENDTAMYSVEKAWHGLGVVVEEAPSPREALKLSGLDWSVVKSPSIIAEYEDFSGRIHEAVTPDTVATIREDTGAILGLVSPNYEVVQNEELFDLAYELGGDVKVETAGSLKNNRQVYILLRGDSFDLPGEDTVLPYMGLFSSHDGSLSLSALDTSVRVVCANTLAQAFSDGRNRIYRIKHSGDVKTKLADLRLALNRFKETGKLFKEKTQILANTSWKRGDIQEFWMNVYMNLEEKFVTNPITEKEEQAYVKASHVIGDWSTRFDAEISEHGFEASAWTAANAVTNYYQHREGARGRKRSDNSRIHNNLLGSAATKSNKVMQMALATV